MVVVVCVVVVVVRSTCHVRLQSKQEAGKLHSGLNRLKTNVKCYASK